MMSIPLPGDNLLPVDLAAVVDQVCDRFEELLKAGEQPSIEQFLVQAEPAGRAALFAELLGLELDYRRQRGEQPARQDYLGRFADYASLVEAALLLSQSAATVAGRKKKRRASQPRLEQAGRFRLLGEIGRGGMGAVLKGHDPDLGRELAVKVVLAEHQGDPAVLGRFLGEAQLAGQLQHPGVVPVYELGRLGDGRPFFAMKLIHGRTLADQLAERMSPGDDLPRFLRYFEAICQTVGYAHSRGVIHRDLKPSNIMVGAFGEVQVMDWGLAKRLSKVELHDAPSAFLRHSEFCLGHPEEPGTVLGTPGYMAPEQARGQTDQVDQRSDVFGLGAILCEILTGTPPFRGPTSQDVLLQAHQSALADAWTRLDGCGADRELVGLTRDCLAVERDDRPASGVVVAERVGAYLAGVQQRLRQAEVGQARAEARAEGERKRRQLTLALAAAVLLLTLAGGSGAWLVQQQRAAALTRQREHDHKALTALERGRSLLKQGWQANDLGRLKEAKAEAARAVEVAGSGASAGMTHQAVAFAQEVQERLGRAEKNRVLREALLDVYVPHESRAHGRDETGRMVALTQLSADEQYAAAFRRWGLDIESTPEAEVVARLKREPDPVREEIVAGLEAWMSRLRSQGQPEVRWRRLLRLAGQLDPRDRRRSLRALLAGEEVPHARDVAGLTLTLASAGQPWTSVAELTRARQERLGDLCRQARPATDPVLNVVLLAEACQSGGDRARAEEVLQQALAARPDQVVLLDALGRLLERQGRARLPEAIECFRAIRARQPRLGILLGMTLAQAGRALEGEAVLRDLVGQQPHNPEMHYYLAFLLVTQNRWAEAEAACRQAIALQPTLAEAHLLMTFVLSDQKKWRQAESACRHGLLLQPNNAEAHNSLGGALYDQKKWQEAETAFRQAIKLKPDYSEAHNNLGYTLYQQKKLVEAETVCRQAVELDRNSARAHVNLGIILNAQGKRKEAEVSFRRAIATDPALAGAHNNLGVTLREQHRLGEAEAACRRALQLQPNYPKAWNNLGNVLGDQGKHNEAVRAYRQALEQWPDYAHAWNGLGSALHRQKKIDEAVAAYRKAIALEPNLGLAHLNIGLILQEQKKLDEAVIAYRKAVRLHPDFAEARFHLAQTLHLQGKFREALAAFTYGLELVPEEDPRRRELEQFAQRLQRQVALNRRLPAVLKGTDKPADAAERIEFALVCVLRKDHAVAARFYRDAFAADPKRAEAVPAGLRYNAACCAALAGCGQDRARLDDSERARWRRQALDWLRADLAWWSKNLARVDAEDRTRIAQRIRHWQSDPDLAGVRDRTALDKLPEAERHEWHKLWADVKALLERASKG
jgi:serine/threonine-protein kinase